LGLGATVEEEPRLSEEGEWNYARFGTYETTLVRHSAVIDCVASQIRKRQHENLVEMKGANFFSEFFFPLSLCLSALTAVSFLYALND
jgi:hypothetical protein